LRDAEWPADRERKIVPLRPQSNKRDFRLGGMRALRVALVGMWYGTGQDPG
jgi:hypothetical protein